MNKDLLAQAIKCLNIQDVYLRESHIAMDEEFNPKLIKFSSITVQYRNGCSKSRVDEVPIENGKTINILSAVYECAYRIVPPELSEDVLNNPDEMEKVTLAEVHATFMAEYSLNCSDLSSEAIEEFCQNNVGYHVWPYWREYAQSTASRLHLPQITIPLYIIPEE